MEDNVVMPLAAVSGIEQDCEPFQNSEDIDSCNDFIPGIDESSDYSDSDNADDEDFHDDEVVENTHDANLPRLQHNLHCLCYQRKKMTQVCKKTQARKTINDQCDRRA